MLFDEYDFLTTNGLNSEIMLNEGQPNDVGPITDSLNFGKQSTED